MVCNNGPGVSISEGVVKIAALFTVTHRDQLSLVLTVYLTEH